MDARLFALLTAFVILFFVLNLIRQQKMTFKYSLIWLGTSAAVFLLATFDQILLTLSKWAGFTLTSNFVFFLLFVFFTLLSLFLTIYINEQNSRTESLAQSIAKLQYQILKLQEENKKIKR